MTMKSNVWAATASIAIWTLFAAQGAFAETPVDPKFPWAKPVPTIEELTGGKIKTGDKITKDNMQYVKDNMAVGMDVLTADGAEWIVAPHTPSSKLIIPGIVEATHRNAGKALVKPDGSVYAADGSPWYGGFPVMQPKTAVEVMVNWLYRDHDTADETGIARWTDPKGNVYKEITAHRSEMFMNGRVCDRPVRDDPGHEGQLRRETLIFESPYDLKGVSVLTVVYQDQSRLPDAWGYIPVLRRVQRFSTAQRDDSLDGSDLRGVNLNLFNDPLGFWNFKIVARKPMLSVFTKDNPTADQYKDKYIPRIKGKYREGAQVELRDTWVIEATPKSGSRIYSRMLLHIDAATYTIWWGSYFDNQGKLWVSGVHPRKRAEGGKCGNYAWLASVEYFNHQTRASYNLDMLYQHKNEGKKAVHAGMLDVRYLQQQGR